MNEMMMLTFLLSLYLTFFQVAYSASKDKPHGHTGILTAYDGKHIPYTLSEEQTKKLDSGEAVRSLFITISVINVLITNLHR